MKSVISIEQGRDPILMKWKQGFEPDEEEAYVLLKEMMKMIELTERQLALMIETKPVFEKLWVVGK
jgi:hypothetical protein